jgi:hypothetical protein
MNEGVLEAARAVRPYLAEFLGSAVAADVDAELAGVLASAASGDDVESRLRAVLEAHEATTVFLDRVLDDAPDFRPPGVVSELKRRYSGFPGQSSPVPADKFRCPYGDYVWYRAEVGVPVERCPTHHCALDPALPGHSDDGHVLGYGRREVGRPVG